jgi:hypothetical protein
MIFVFIASFDTLKPGSYDLVTCLPHSLQSTVKGQNVSS